MTLSNDTMLCLRWNNASSKLNLSDALQELRKEEDFFDVSLGCSDGPKASALRAHKVILSAYSTVFKDMLKKHSNQKDPFIYMKGVSQDELSSMLDFMYLGEVYVQQSNLSTFLNVAKDLQIKGLTENVKSPVVPAKPNPFSNRLKESTTKFSLEKNPLADEKRTQRPLLQVEDESDLEKALKKVKYEKNLMLSSLQDPKPVSKFSKPLFGLKSKLERSNGISARLERSNGVFAKQNRNNGIAEEDDDEKNENGAQSESNNAATDDHSDEFEELPSDTKGTIKDLMFRMGRKVEHGKKMRQMAKCRLCSKEGRTDHIQNHIKTAHQASLISTESDNVQNESYIPEMETEIASSEINTSNENLEEKESAPAPSVEEFIEEIDKRVQQGSHIRKFSRCKICSKECRSDNIRAHIKHSHADVIGNDSKTVKQSRVKLEKGVENDVEEVEIERDF